MFNSERNFIKNNKREASDESLNVSFSSSNSSYKNLSIKEKIDIIFLIRSGYNKRMIIKLYLLAKPSNLNEAVHYLTKENGIYQHIFYESPNKEDTCQICGEKPNMHINKIDKAVNISFDSKYTFKNCENKNISNNDVNEEKDICKICEENINEYEKLNNKCEQCYSYFCNECLYLYIKELIKNGNHILFCPECKNIYSKNKIEQIFSLSKDKEVNNLRILFEKNNTKEIVLSNPELMFCPIVNCVGFAKKNDDKDYNICNMGHKFCIKCGEKWHENGKCKEEENVDKLFKKYCEEYNLKNCPCCNIIIVKTGGCNHMHCKYCDKHWCWLCNEIFDSTEEHYGNINSNCYNQMMDDDNQMVICSKCDTEINENNTISFECDHIICHNCFTSHLLKSDTMIFYYHLKLIECLIKGCKGKKVRSVNWLIKFIKERNNKILIKKYKNSVIFYQYIASPFQIENYFVILGKLLYFVKDIFQFCEQYKVLYGILRIIGYFFYTVLIILYLIIIPIYAHFAIKIMYYSKLLPEIQKRSNNKLIIFFIVLGEEIFSLVFMISLFIFHYIIFGIIYPIICLIILIINICYFHTCY